MDIFPVDWVAKEHEDSFEILCFGKRADQRSVCVHIPFYPYFYVQCPPTWPISRQRLFISDMATSHNALLQFSMPVQRKSIWGYAPATAHHVFVQLAFPTLAASKRARRYITDRHKLKTFEASVDPLMRLFHVRNLEPAGWLHITSWKAVDDKTRLSTASMEIMAQFTDLAPSSSPETAQTVPPLVFASWDIECYSASGAFPMADKPGDVICAICTTFQRYGEPLPYKRHAAILGTCADVDGVDILVQCETEAEVLNAWIAALAEEEADILLAYNSYGFDYKYVYGRSLMCVDDETAESLVSLHLLGKSTDGSGGQPVQKQLTSAAYGDNNYFFLSAHGCIHLDLLQLVKKEHKLDSYTLNNVSEKFLGDKKLDLPPAEIFAKFVGTAEDRALIVEYCVKDTELPLQLMNKLNIFQNMVEMANATSVPLDYLITRGQQIKVFSLILKKARQLGFVCPDVDRSQTAGAQSEQTYEGATVLNAEKGAYLEDIVSALDFASLYPSIMRAHNLCLSTLVMHDAYAALPDVEYFVVDTPRGTFSFVQNVQSVVPALLDDLAQFRKNAKKKMAEAKDAGDHFAAAVYNGKQLAYKICMNSAYGFFGAQKGFLACIPLALSVTTVGRNMIATTKTLVEDMVQGSRVIYGDSVADYTPIYLQRHGTSWMTTFAALASSLSWDIRGDGKECAACDPDLCIWSDGGWTPLQCLIRHAYDPNKGLIRVLTQTGLVDVTPDHSLVTANGHPIKPVDVTVGDVLLHHDMPHCLCSPRAGEAVIDHEEYAWCLGLLYCGTDKCVPQSILAASEAVRQSFWEGVCYATENQSIDQFSQLSACTMMAVAHSLGHQLVLDCDPVAPHTVSLRRTPDAAAPTDTVKKIYSLAYSGTYVYDATTANHHFAVAGRLVVHNTDSVLCILNAGPGNRTNMHAHFEVAQRLADAITTTFKKPNELEFEKCYRPYILFSKKRYAGLLYTNPDTYDYMDAKGIQLIRRDNAPLVKTVSKAVLETLMHEKSLALAVEVVKTHLLRVLRNEEPLEAYIVSKALRTEYKNPESQPHLMVARKIAARRGAPVPSGERVPFVYIESADHPDGLQAQRAEDPGYVRDHGLVVDRLHYVESQLTGPLETLLDVVHPGTFQRVLDDPEIKPLIGALRMTRSEAIKVAKRVRTNSQNRQREITSFLFRA